jgi:L-lactate dehydrogenase complex protein LldG
VSVLAAFETQLTRVGAGRNRTAAAAAPGAAIAILREHGCRSLAVAGAVPGRDEYVLAARAAGLAVVEPGTIRPTRAPDGGISLGRLGVAETGSVLVHSTAADRRLELCVDVHVVLLDAGSVVPTLDEALARVRELSARPPAYASLVTGPSRSADIERRLAVGVHGPGVLHVLLLER